VNDPLLYYFTTDFGRVEFRFPATVKPADVADAEEFFAIIVKSVRRIAAKNATAPPVMETCCECSCEYPQDGDGVFCPKCRKGK
jgi:hypothetical protein